MKKTDELSLEKTLEFAAKCYENKKTVTGVELFVFCKQVARQAEQIARRLFLDLRPDYISDNAKDNITAIVHCAVLYDVLNVSACAFEHIADVTNVQVAAMVAAISRDFRLVETKRDMEFRGRLSQSPVGAQIVITAQIICAAKSVDRVLDGAKIPGGPKAKKILAQMDGDLLAIRAADKYYALRLYTTAARNLLVTVSQSIKAAKQQAKAEKLVLQNTKNLRESRAEGLPVTEKTGNASKPKREKRYEIGRAHV